MTYGKTRSVKARPGVYYAESVLGGDELVAVRYGLGATEPGDLLAIFADAITTVWKMVIYWGKEPRQRDRGIRRVLP